MSLKHLNFLNIAITVNGESRQDKISAKMP